MCGLVVEMYRNVEIIHQDHTSLFWHSPMLHLLNCTWAYAFLVKLCIFYPILALLAFLIAFYFVWFLCFGVRGSSTSRKVADLDPNEVIGFFKFTWNFQSHYGPEVNSASNRKEYQQSSWGEGGKGRPAPKAGNIIFIYEMIV
jgi:hypothetical protein